MNKKAIQTTIFILLFIVILIIFGMLFWKNPIKLNQIPENNISTSTIEKLTALEYKNNQYGFVFLLPDSWKDYKIITDKWIGNTNGSEGEKKFTEGSLISIRHPLWTDKSPRQDIPIMVFTLSQWQDLQADKFHIGAAPIGPSELGRNAKYVFALPARYNFAFPIGYEEVDKLIQNNSFHAL